MILHEHYTAFLDLSAHSPFARKGRLSMLAKPALRKRHIVGWRQVERQRAAIRARQRSGPAPKRVR
jgi:hypothetical protein